ncbi:hypothetical protein [Flavobacterium sp. N2270]|uniref:hypothetical protein n=1 Tax=Flavobacterium sp. N2270 TaxID=2986831 RepID=UPI00222432E5|nr:hypothetical protein [Flavobacterium sp. N2270]
MENNYLKKDYLLVAFGLSAWLAISGFAYSVEILFENLLILTNFDNKFKFWFTDILFNISNILSFYFFLKIIKPNVDYLKWIKFFIILYIITQVFQFLFTSYVGAYIVENYHESWVNQTDFYLKYTFGLILKPIITYVRLIIVSFLFYSFYEKAEI